MAVTWSKFIEDVFVAAVHQTAKDSDDEGWDRHLEKRIRDKTRKLLAQLAKEGRAIRRMAASFYRLAKQDTEISSALSKMNEPADRFVERFERTLVAFAQAVKEQFPQEARMRDEGVFRVEWEQDLSSVTGRWHWHYDRSGEPIPLVAAAVEAAEFFGEFPKHLIRPIGIALIAGLRRREVNVPGFRVESKKGITELHWLSPVVESPDSRALSAPIPEGIPDDPQLILFNHHMELTALVDAISRSKIVEDEEACSQSTTDTTKISPKVFSQIVDRLTELLAVKREDLERAMLRIAGGQVNETTTSQELEQTVERLQKLTRLVEVVSPPATEAMDPRQTA